METAPNVSSSKLLLAANITEILIPYYDIKKSDPIRASETGVGNCIAKAAIAGAILDWAVFNGVPAALAWNKNTHPKYSINPVGQRVALNGHAQLVSTTNYYHPYEKFTALSFNPNRVSAEDWEQYEFRSVLSEKNYAEVDQGRIIASQEGINAGFVIETWHEGGKLYMEELGVYDSEFHITTRKDMGSILIDHLCTRKLLTKFKDGAGTRHKEGNTTYY